MGSAELSALENEGRSAYGADEFGRESTVNIPTERYLVRGDFFTTKRSNEKGRLQFEAADKTCRRVVLPRANTLSLAKS